MARKPMTPGDDVQCPACGHRQEGGRMDCVRCGAPLSAPGLIYRKLPDGRWSIVRGIDLSSLAPKPDRQPRKWLTRQGALAIAAAVVLMLGLLWMALKMGQTAREKEAQEVAQYLLHPVGKIVPRFQLQYARAADGSLQVTGQCNLPTGTLLDVRVLAGEVLVAVDYPVKVSAGSFETRSLLNRGRPFVAGLYRTQIKADFGPRWQPAAVLLVVGGLGERLDGPLIGRRGSSLERGLTYSEDFSLD